MLFCKAWELCYEKGQTGNFRSGLYWPTLSEADSYGSLEKLTKDLFFSTVTAQ